MDSVHFSESNRTYKAPTDWDEEANGPCADLHVYEADGRISSVWKPTEAELAMLNAGGCIVLSIISSYQPPVSLWTTTVEPVAETTEAVVEVAPEVVPAAVVDNTVAIEEPTSEIVEGPFPEVTDFKNGATPLDSEEEHDTIQDVAEKHQRRS